MRPSARKPLALSIAAAAIALWLSTSVTTQQPAPALALSAPAIQQIDAFESEKAQRTPAQRKISSRLLYAARMRRGEPPAPGAPMIRSSVSVDDEGQVEADIRAVVTPGLLDAITATGATIVDSVPAYRSIRVRIPLAEIESLASRPDVLSIAPADRMMTNLDNTSQGDTAHRAHLARSLFGVTGAGVGIGVLSNGVNSLAARQATGDLPSVTVLPGQAGSGDEGTAMLEIVHDLAPNSPLFFATALGGQAQFATNIQALCAAGARVIVDDVSYFAEAVFQDGIAAQGVNAAVGSGCFYFSSAGNSGNLNDGTSGVWEGDFVAASSNPPTVVGIAHDFGGGATSDQLTLDPSSFIVLKWSDPLGGSANDYDLYLFDPTLSVVFDLSNDTQDGTQDPVETIDSQAFNDLNNRLVIVRRTGAARYLHLNTNRGRLALRTSGQTFGHNAAANAFGVAAVNASSGNAFTTANPIETYSSDGLRRIFYDAAGAAITPGNFSSTGGQVLQKPDLAAADCVATATPGFNPFCGTSAAAPHAAAIAALMLEAAGGPSSLTLAQMRSAIAARSIDIEAGGVDRDSGSGIADALGVVGRVHPAFFDSTLIPGSTPIKEIHLSQLRARVNAQRIRCGLSVLTWTDNVVTPGMTQINAVHLVELRSGLNAAYTACGMSPPSYTDPSLSGVAIKALHFNELRAAVVALE